MHIFATQEHSAEDSSRKPPDSISTSIFSTNHQPEPQYSMPWLLNVNEHHKLFSVMRPTTTKILVKFGYLESCSVDFYF